MTTAQLNRTFAALADPTRRAILSHLASGDATVSELPKPLPISIQAVSKHLAVLERGYSITHKLGDGRIVKDAASLAIGDLVRITFALGKSLCRVERKE